MYKPKGKNSFGRDIRKLVGVGETRAPSPNSDGKRPVCDFKSWPGGMPKKLGTGKGSEGEWKKLLAAYVFKSDEEAIAYKLNPVDNLTLLAKAKIPLLLVYGDKDTVVPHAENSELVYNRYKALGGAVERVVKPGQDHHPHGLKDVTPVVRFFTDALAVAGN